MTLRPGMPSVAPASTAETVVHELASRFRDVRAVTERLAAPLSAEDCALQSMPDASPTKWHLAHTSWFFETFVLERGLPHFACFHPGFRTLFNSYYVGVGPRHPRPERGLLSRPSLDEVLAYRRHVDRAMERLFTAGLDRDLAGTVELGIHHEQQHQELILTDLKHLLSRNPLHPAYLTLSPAREASTTRALDWIAHPPGLRSIGHDAAGFCFDNETPRHRAYVAAFEIADRPVTNGEYLAFIEDKGYARPELWLAEGWDTRAAHDWRAPLYWLQDADDWFSFTVNGLQPLDPAEPVAHVSYYEADAYARWTGARLPTEHEWETLATSCPVDGHFLESGRWHPRAALCERDGAVQVYGDVWEWTGSAYSPYPGYRPMAGAIGEYNGKFMVNQYVLRGGSCATPRSHIRATYRNFFPAAARWQFSGIRLARDRD